MTQRNFLGPLLAAAFAIATPAAAQVSTSRVPTGAPACFETAYNAKDAQALALCFADTVNVYSVGPDSVRALLWTQAEIRATYERIFARIPKAKQTTLGTLVEGPYVAVSERLDEVAPGVAATGLSVYRLRAGRITGLWAFSDH